jgi:hypothetical protein
VRFELCAARLIQQLELYGGALAAAADEAGTFPLFMLSGTGQQVDQVLRLLRMGGGSRDTRRVHGCEFAARRQ